MKKNWIIIILLFCNASVLFAQTSKGKFLLGASSNFGLMGSGSNIMYVRFSSSKYETDNIFDNTDTDKTTTFNLLPKFGYFIIDDLAIGLDVNTALSKNKDGESDNKYTQSLLTVGPFLRYFIPTSKISPFFEVGSTVGFTKSKYEYSDNSFDDEEYKSKLFSFEAGIGIAIPLGEKAAIDFVTNYQYVTVKDLESNTSSDKLTIGTLGLKIGFSLIL